MTVLTLSVFGKMAGDSGISEPEAMTRLFFRRNSHKTITRSPNLLRAMINFLNVYAGLAAQFIFSEFHENTDVRGFPIFLVKKS